MSRQPDDHYPEEELIFLLERDLKIACDALKEIQTLPSVRDNESSDIAYRARKSIEWGGK